jgi:hypothetical protein
MLDREDPLVVGQNAELGLCRRHAPKPGDNAATGTDSLWPRVASVIPVPSLAWEPVLVWWNRNRWSIGRADRCLG